MSVSAIPCVFDGSAFQPTTPFHLRRAREAFGAGEIVMMTAEQERSMRSHRHYFAAIKEAWDNLPERFALEPWAMSPDHLRRYALIRTNHADTETLPCASVAEARRWAERMKPLDAYSIVTVKGDTVLRFTAKSQSLKSMGAEAFQKSKVDVLEFLDDLIGVDRGELERRGRAA